VRPLRSVVELCSFGTGAEAGLRGKPVEVAADVLYEHIREIGGEAVPNHYPLHHQILAVGGHAVGGDLPATIAKAVGKIVERPVSRLPQLPRKDREVRSVAEQLERAEGGDLAGEMPGDVLASLVDSPVARLSEADQVVILSDDLAGRPREIDGERRHGAAEVIHVKDEVRVQIRCLPPDDPTPG